MCLLQHSKFMAYFTERISILLFCCSIMRDGNFFFFMHFARDSPEIFFFANVLKKRTVLFVITIMPYSSLRFFNKHKRLNRFGKL